MTNSLQASAYPRGFVGVAAHGYVFQKKIHRNGCFPAYDGDDDDKAN